MLDGGIKITGPIPVSSKIILNILGGLDTYFLRMRRCANIYLMCLWVSVVGGSGGLVCYVEKDGRRWIRLEARRIKLVLDGEK